jgi:membrane carboxypeptidase/penicillin-binding protein
MAAPAASAMLIGLLQGRELFSPFRKYSFAKQRQKTVLEF